MSAERGTEDRLRIIFPNGYVVDINVLSYKCSIETPEPEMRSYGAFNSRYTSRIPVRQPPAKVTLTFETNDWNVDMRDVNPRDPSREVFPTPQKRLGSGS